MIRRLHISNYALISHIDIDFAAGLNIITGETGAGKSIILGALGLLLGDRADLKVVRDSGAKSIIEAEFEIPAGGRIEKLLRDNDIDTLEGICILRRELLPGGRSRAFINDTPSSISLLKEVATYLVDIHSQHQNLLISDPGYQLNIIDSLSSNEELLEKYRQAYTTYRKYLKAYTDTRERIRRSQNDADYIRFQYDKLSEMDLKPGEQEALERERDVLGNLTEIKDDIDKVLAPLYYQDTNAVSLVAQAADACESLASNLEEDIAHKSSINIRSLTERLNSVKIELSDITDTLQNYESSLQADPRRLQEIEERLSELYSLEMKHHVSTPDELISIKDLFEKQLEELSNSDQVLARLENAARKAKKEAVLLANDLSEKRTETATKFAEILKERATPLGMPNLRCEVTLTKEKLGPEGSDKIEFLFAFNKNQNLMPVGSTASGGEISRLMLCIKSIIAEKMALPTIIFDEVDTGVSGEIARRMAEMMNGIGKKIQVITITHLPGVAAYGSRHFKVFKEDDEQSTHTRIKILDPKERIREIALMLSGSSSDEAALANAEALLNQSNK